MGDEFGFLVQGVQKRRGGLVGLVVYGAGSVLRFTIARK